MRLGFIAKITGKLTLRYFPKSSELIVQMCLPRPYFITAY